MENQEIMLNDGVVDVVEEVTTTGSGNGLKIVGGILAIAGAIYGGYKFVSKRKSKKNKYATPVLKDDDAEEQDVVEVEDNE